MSSEPGDGASTRRSLALIVNPRSGRRRGAFVADRVATRLARRFDLSRHLTEAPGHARELAASIELEGLAGVCAIGGDGTLHEVVDGLLARGEPDLPPVGVIAAGSGNSVARDLGVLEEAEALRHIERDLTRPIDVARVQVDGRVLHSINVIGWGAFARINRRAETYRWAVGQRYNLAALRELAQPRLVTGGLRLPGVDPNGRWFLGAACITPTTGTGLRIAPDAVLDDGLLDVVLIRMCSRWRLLALLAAVARGTHLASEAVEVHRVASLELELEAGSHLIIDGECLPARRVSIGVLGKALRIFGGST